MSLPETWDSGPFAAGLAPGQTSRATKYQETKRDWSQLWKNEIQKAQKPSFHFWRAVSKCRSPTHSTTKRMGRPPKPPLQTDPWTCPCPHSIRGTSSLLLEEQTRETVIVLTSSCCSRGPSKSLPECSVWPLINFYWLRRQEPWSVTLSPLVFTSLSPSLNPVASPYKHPLSETIQSSAWLALCPLPRLSHTVVTLLPVPSPTQLNVAGDSHGHSDLSHWNSWSLTLWEFSAFPDNQTAHPMSILSPFLPNLGSVTFSVKWWILNIFGFEGHHRYATSTQLCSLANQSLCPEPCMISSLASNFPCFLPCSYFQLNSYWNRTEKLEANRKQCPQTLPMRTRVQKPTFWVLWTHCFCFWWGQPSSSRTQGPTLGFLCISYFHSLMGCLSQYTNTMIFLCMCAKSSQLCPTLLWPYGL